VASALVLFASLVGGWLLGELITPPAVSLWRRQVHSLRTVQRINITHELDEDLFTHSWDELVDPDGGGQGRCPVTSYTREDVDRWLLEDFTRDEMEEIYLVRTARLSTHPIGILYATLYTPLRRVVINFLVAKGDPTGDDDRAIATDLWQCLLTVVDAALVRSTLPYAEHPILVRFIGPLWARVLRVAGRGPHATCVFAVDLKCECVERPWARFLCDFVENDLRGSEVRGLSYVIPFSEPHPGGRLGEPARIWAIAGGELLDSASLIAFMYRTHYFWAFVYGDEELSLTELTRRIAYFQQLVDHVGVQT